MRYLLFLLAGLFIFSACENQQEFAGVSNQDLTFAQASLSGGADISEGDGSSHQASSQEATSPRSQKRANPHTRKLKATVKAQLEVKISGKKRKAINVTETVGGKDFGRSGDEGLLEQVEVEGSFVSSDEDDFSDVESVDLDIQVRTVSSSSSRDRNRAKEAHSLPKTNKLDALFYIGDRNDVCVQSLSHYAKENAFLAHLEPLDWHISFAFHSDGPARLIPLEYYNGKAHHTGGFFESTKPDYLLSKGEYEDEVRDRLFSMTLRPSSKVNYNWQDLSNNHRKNTVEEKLTPDSPERVAQNPLSGLDVLLSGNPLQNPGKLETFRRPGAKPVVVLLGYDYAYYSKKEWAHFFRKHNNVSLIALGSREANVSNFIHILEKDKYDFEFIPSCDGPKASLRVLEAIGRHF